jgi:phosphate acetyltransferase
VSPAAGSGFLEQVKMRAAALSRRIVFPESGDERTLAAVRALKRDRIVEPVVVVDPRMPAARLSLAGLGVEIVDPTRDPRREAIVAHLLQRRAHRGLTEAEANRLVDTPLYFADGLVAIGEVDGCVAGAVHTTGDVLRAALWLVGSAEGVSTVSSAFYMVTASFRGAGQEVLTFTDCAVVPYPTPRQLADIAIAAAGDRRRIVGDEPRVAMLSFSTRGSASGPTVEAVREAVQLVRAEAPDLAVDGELQCDAALIRSVADRKAPGSPVAGAANVLVFPCLDSGNIGYKLVQRLAGASAIGPIIQGLARPCSDLSRGAVPDDIINVAAITALQGGRRPNSKDS